MKKNRGFTLIELLAVIVITGILSIMIVPKISNIVSESKMKLYVQDAKKMLTQAQYRMSANNADIEKPEIGECIIFSLNYLAVNDFRNPPNDGKYMDESSFVVVKNESGTLEYAVMLVEHRKDGLYQGVEFVTEKQLNRNDALKHVRYFDSSDIRYIDRTYTSAEEGNDLQGTSDKVFIDSEFINQELRKSGLTEEKWLKDDSITKTYNKIKADKTVVADAAVPTFSAKITTNNTSGLGILQATLTINAEDADDALNSLTVCTRVTKTEDGIYPTRSNRELCEAYGNSRYYTKNIDFQKYGLDYDSNSIGYVYITVFDPSGHSARKLREYVVHKNDGPVIYSLNLNKRDSDKENMGTAQLKIHVQDDIDDKTDLEVCIEKDYINQSGICSNTYRNYYSVFNYNDVALIDFDSRPDGSTHTVTVYVRDTERKVSYTTAEYTLYTNTIPTFSNIKFTPVPYDQDPSYNSLDYNLKMLVEDDLSDEDHIFIKIGDSAQMTYTQYLTEYYRKPNAVFTAPGILDGIKRTIVVKVWDEYEQESSANYLIFNLDNVYRAAPPSVTNFKLIDAERVCMDNDHCLDTKSDEYGAYKVKFQVCLGTDCSNHSSRKANAKICISENKNYCLEDPSNLSHYMTFDKLDDFTYEFSPPQGYSKYEKQNDVRKLYYNVIEYDNMSNPLSRYNEMSESFSQKYTIYANKAPVLTSTDVLTVTSSSNVHQSPEVRLEFKDTFKVKDDFNDYKVQICQRVIESNTDIFEEFLCTEAEDFEDVYNYYKKYKFHLRDNNGNLFSGVNHGELVNLFVRFIDHKGQKTDSDKVGYSLADESAPYISTARIDSQSKAENYNSYFFTLSYVVTDPGDTYTLCLKEANGDDYNVCRDEDFKGDEDGNPYQAAASIQSIGFNGNTLFNWPTDYKDPNPEKHLVLAVKDSKGNIDIYNTRHANDLVYTLYSACQDENVCYADDGYPKFEPVSGEITPEVCNGVCIKYDQNTGQGLNLYAVKNRIFEGKDIKSKSQCHFEEDVKEYCNSKSCFIPTDSDTEYKYLGITRYDQNQTWTYEAEAESEKVYDEKDSTNIYCNQLYKENETDIDGALFTEKDKRCSESYSSYCNSIFAPNACKQHLIDNETDEYYNCLTQQESLCKITLQQFCSNPVSKTHVLVDCNEPHTQQYYCDLNTLEAQMLGGQCIHSSPNCTPDPEENSDEEGESTSTEPLAGGDSNDVIGDSTNGSVGTSSSINLDNSCTLYEINHNLCNSNDFYCSEEAYEQGLCEKAEVISTQAGSSNTDLEYDCDDKYKVDGKCLPLCSEAYNYSDWGKLCIRRQDAIFPEESTCRTVCYKIVDCTPRMKTVTPTYDCHGFYKEYFMKPTTETEKVVLQENISKIWCPEFVNDDRFRQKYFGFDKGYIVFDENQVIDQRKDFSIEEGVH